MDDLEVTTTDVLINRVIERATSVDDWSALADRARLDPRIWSTLNGAIRADGAVAEAAEHAASGAATVELPRFAHRGVDRDVARRSAFARIGPWSGWLAAAASIALLALVRGGMVDGPDAVEPGIRTVTASSDETADEALRRYLRLGAAEGRILDELPLITVNAARAPGESGYEVVYLRRLIERRHVSEDAVFKVASDDAGRAVVVPASPESDGGRNPI